MFSAIPQHMAQLRRLCWRGPAGSPVTNQGFSAVQSARPRDLGALALVVGVFLVLFVVSITLGTSAIR